VEKEKGKVLQGGIRTLLLDFPSGLTEPFGRRGGDLEGSPFKTSTQDQRERDKEIPINTGQEFAEIKVSGLEKRGRVNISGRIRSHDLARGTSEKEHRETAHFEENAGVPHARTKERRRPKSMEVREDVQQGSSKADGYRSESSRGRRKERGEQKSGEGRFCRGKGCGR